MSLFFSKAARALARPKPALLTTAKMATAGSMAAMTSALALAAAAPEQCVEDDAYAAFKPPPAKYDDPAQNALILEEWRKLIQDARELFAKFDYASAERALQQALEKANHFGHSSGPVATSLLNLAQLYKRTGRYGDAIPLLIEATDVLEQTAGPHNKVTLTCLIDLADIHLANGDASEALTQFDKIIKRLDVAERNQKHGLVALREVRASCLFRMAKASISLGAFDDAEERLRTTLSILEERHGQTSPKLLAPCVELARVLAKQGRAGEGQEFFSRAAGLEKLKPAQTKQLKQAAAELGMTP